MSKISIIVPLYNSEKYLDKCIKSILNQTFKNFELILVNDGSKDKSLEICNKYAKRILG
ncbi:glycosyltransferase family 2 protein [Clostridium perfringens]|uniref:glycosyltransferase family 2 protein n=1 Tax=Clostridium perfringens TaxID=1502 RepID=UPI000E1708DF|nr:glycosyltransferase family 2 protein [Clostridium perfringens]SUY29951.1 glycosyl transferase [Clostridium perfringens]